MTPPARPTSSLAPAAPTAKIHPLSVPSHVSDSDPKPFDPYDPEVLARANRAILVGLQRQGETAEEAELIRNLGCDKIQGYYFGRPMASIEAQRLFNNPRVLRA